MVIPYNEEEACFNRMTKHRAIFLMTWLLNENSKNGNPFTVDEVIANFYGSKTFAALMDEETDLYWASENALISLLKCELIGDMETWNRKLSLI